MIGRLLTVAACAALLIPGCSSEPELPTQAGGGSGTETVGIMGVFVDPAGTAVAGAEVKAVSDDSTVYATTTDANGAYLIEEMATTTYTLQAAYNDSELVALVPGIAADSIEYLYDSDSLLFLLTDSYEIPVRFVRTDTMYAPGTVSGTALIHGADHSGTHAYVPGTSFGAMTDAAGMFTISFLPPGVYTVYIDHQGYTTAAISDVVVHAGENTPLDTVSLARDPDAPPSRPDSLWASYDTLSGTVTLTWTPVDVSDLAGYRVYLDTGSSGPEIVSIGIVTDTSYRHVAFASLLDPRSLALPFQVTAIDTLNDESLFSDKVTVQAPSPTSVRTTIAILPLDSAVVEDTLGIIAQCSNPTRTNTAIRWYVDTHDSAGLLSEETLSNASFVDTVTYFFEQVGPRWFFVEVQDDGGSLWQDSARITARGVQVPQDTCLAGPALAVARRHLAAVPVGERLYAIGGQSNLPTRGSLALDVVEVYAEGTGWVADSSLSGPRYAAAVAALGDTLYVIGGSSNTGDLTSIEACDCVNQRWFTHGTTMPKPTQSAAACACNGRIYVAGGIDGIAPNGWEPTLSNAIAEFDPRVGTWSIVAHMQYYRCYHQMVALNGRLYVIGGVGGTDSLWSHAGILGSVEVFDPTGPSVAPGPALPSGRMLFGAAVLDTAIYVTGGLTQKNGGQCLRSVLSLSSQAGTWHAERWLPSPVQNHAVCAMGQALYIVGGAESALTADAGELSNVWLYYP